MTEHTKTPWTQDEILRVCNAHDVLLAACKAALKRFCMLTPYRNGDLKNQLLAAISATKGRRAPGRCDLDEAMARIQAAQLAQIQREV